MFLKSSSQKRPGLAGNPDALLDAQQDPTDHFGGCLSLGAGHLSFGTLYLFRTYESCGGFQANLKNLRL